MLGHTRRRGGPGRGRRSAEGARSPARRAGLAHPGAGRGDVRAGRAQRAPGAGGHPGADARAHRARHRAPPVHRAGARRPGSARPLRQRNSLDTLSSVRLVLHRAAFAEVCGESGRCCGCGREAAHQQQHPRRFGRPYTGPTVCTHAKLWRACAQAAEKIVVLDDGRVAEVGTHAQLVERRGLYAELVSSQSLSLSAV